MQDLQLTGVHEDGEHLLLAGDDGTRYRLPIDDALRADVRPRREPPAGSDAGVAELRPRDVQALIRSGASAEETAEQAGWTVEKVHRYEGPILAEREHIASLARRVSVRERTPGGAASVQTIEARVIARLADRGVSADTTTWDAWRRETGPWTVVAVFPAGGRERQASWHFDPADRTLTPLDDEARWLIGDAQEQVGGPIPTAATPRRRTRVYDVEAEGGLRPAERDPRPADTFGAPDAPDGADLRESGGEDDAESSASHPLDLMTAMRERSGARGRRSGRRTKRSKREAAPPTSPAHVPGSEDVPDDALPLEDIAYDPETMPPPPAAHGPHEDAPADSDTGDDGDDAGDGGDEDAGERPAPEGRFEEVGLFDAVEETSATDAPVALEDTPEDEEPTVPEQVEDRGQGDDEDPGDASGPGTDQMTPVAGEAPAGVESDQRSGAAATVAAEPEQQEQQRGTPRRSTRKSGRPSVPSWDDIMFGSPHGER